MVRRLHRLSNGREVQYPGGGTVVHGSEAMLEVKVRDFNDERRVALIGDVTLDTMAQLRICLLGAARNPPAMVTIDASRVAYAYSGGLAALVELYARLQRAGSRLRILNPSEMMRDLLIVTALNKIIPVEEDEEGSVCGYSGV